MAKKPKYEVVLFDVGNTLLFPNWERILAPLTCRGLSVSQNQLHAIERKTKKDFDQSAVSGRIDHGFWQLFYSHLLDTLGISDAALCQSLVAATHLSANWDRIRPGTRQALDAIRARYRIGVISNADGKIADVLTISGIRDCFLSVTDSGIVGYEKPHPAIFAAALRAMNVEPQRAMYVGDVYSVDYVGATNAGMDATLFDVAAAYHEKNLPRVESLQQLQQRLESEFI